MRPVRLSVKGFTAFRDEAEIDFDELDLFAITGPTGSGKSSLLDAITYALYGRAERVGREAGRLVSLGQPRMSVMLEFRAGGESYRVTRSTPAGTGATRIRLERRSGGEWVQAGDGSDRVREANRMIEGLVGLDYDGFTRSVLLPQGRFSEFLVGDAGVRRNILTELLGLGLYERMGKAAGEIRREAEAGAAASQETLESEYSDVTEETIERARSVALEARRIEADLERAAAAVEELAGRDAEAEREVDRLAGIEAEGRDLVTRAESIGEAVGRVEREAATADSALEGLRGEAAEAARELTEVSGRLADLRGRYGTESELTLAAERARELRRHQREGAERAERARGDEAALAALERALAAKGEAAKAGAGEEARLQVAFEAAQEAWEAALRDDHVAHLTGGLSPGDPCPVCARPLESLPPAPGARALTGAEETLDRVRRLRDEARLRAASAAADVLKAEGDLKAARQAAERSAAEVAASAAGEAESRRKLEEMLGEGPVADPEGEISRRGALVAESVEQERRAQERASRIQADLAGSERAAMLAGQRVTEQRAKLEALPVAAFLERSNGRIPPVTGPAAEGPAAASLDSVEEAAAAIRDRVMEAVAEVERRRGESVAQRRDFLRQALDAAGGLAGAAGDLRSLSASLRERARSVVEERARAEDARDELTRRSNLRDELETRIAARRRRAAAFKALAAELRADRLIEHLQAESLRALAAGASDHLRRLSVGRYALECQGDEFFVLDTWNGEERRSARTLSGGETFLASLALALALSEQVGTLAVEERAPLESLFLDEGFGTLDAESLEVVVEALEQLGDGDRLVGVITHVRDLAERMPRRITVVKSPRGSTLAPDTGPGD